ncbi:MAG: hypothetical protein U9N04_03670, partial [Patescibacteria group bacterium]|nr:hypothetical protein [Patescibacteria group bacterium]
MKKQSLNQLIKSVFLTVFCLAVFSNIAIVTPSSANVLFYEDFEGTPDIVSWGTPGTHDWMIDQHGTGSVGVS